VNEAQKFVQIIQSDLKSDKNMGACLGLAQMILRTAGHDLTLMFDVTFEQFLDVHLLRGC
jgi:hypothetical protein